MNIMRNIGFKECVKENELIKKTLWISIPILILVTIYPYVNFTLEKYFAISNLKIEQNPVYIIVEVMSLFIRTIRSFKNNNNYFF